MNHPLMLLVTALIWGLIEVIDAAFLSFNIAWWLSALMALVIVYGGVLIYIESDGGPGIGFD